MMAKPIKTLELHYPMIQFLIISINRTQIQPQIQTHLKTTSSSSFASFVVAKT